MICTWIPTTLPHTIPSPHSALVTFLFLMDFLWAFAHPSLPETSLLHLVFGLLIPFLPQLKRNYLREAFLKLYAPQVPHPLYWSYWSHLLGYFPCRSYHQGTKGDGLQKRIYGPLRSFSTLKVKPRNGNGHYKQYDCHTNIKFQDNIPN